MNYEVIIIGAGLGGLIAGAKLAKNGKKVLVLEQHFKPGGCATIFKRKDFIFEVGLHELDGFNETGFKSKIFKEFEVFNHVDFIRLPEFYNTVWKEHNFVMPDNLKDAKAQLLKEFPQEEQGVLKFFGFITGVSTEISMLPKGKFEKFVKGALFPIYFPKLVKSTQITVGRFLDDIIKDERLKLILLSNVTYYHDDPYSLGMFYFSAGQSSYYQDGGYFIKGGSQMLSNYLMKYIKEHGGEVKLKNKVNKIIVQEGKAVGVKYHAVSDKDMETTTAYGKAIIANTAIPNLSNELLPETEAEMLNEQTKSMEYGPSILSLYLGFSKKPKEIGNKHYSTFVIDDSVGSIKDIHINNKDDFNKRSFVFVDYGMIDSGLAADGKAVGTICTMDYYENWADLDKDDYKKKKEEVQNLLIERLEKQLPGIKKIIEYSELGTPKTIERYTLNPQGSPYGYAQTLDQSARKRLKNKSIIPGLYYASAWSSPGGGFSGAIYSGYTCALAVLKDLTKEKIE